jgi:hypothetical protein
MKIGKNHHHQTEAYQLWVDNIKAQTRFESMAQATKEYMGEMRGMQSLAQRIRQLS